MRAAAGTRIGSSGAGSAPDPPGMNLAIMLAGSTIWTVMGFFGSRHHLRKPEGPPRALAIVAERPPLAVVGAALGVIGIVLVVLSSLNLIEDFLSPHLVGAVAPLGLLAGAMTAVLAQEKQSSTS